MKYDWTAARVAQLTDWWIKGFSAGQIARLLEGSVTRNAVIGKILRLGLMGRPAAAPPPSPRHKRPTPPPKVPRPILAKPKDAKPFLFGGTSTRKPTPIRAVPDHGTSKTLLELEENDCRWPVGEGGEHRFCAAQVKNPYSYSAHGRYCPHHNRESKQSTVQTVRNEHAAEQAKAA